MLLALTGVSKAETTLNPQQVAIDATGRSRGALNTSTNMSKAHASHLDFFELVQGGQTTAHKHIGRRSAQPSSNGRRRQMESMLCDPIMYKV
jgi:hypothetical protein